MIKLKTYRFSSFLSLSLTMKKNGLCQIIKKGGKGANMKNNLTQYNLFLLFIFRETCWGWFYTLSDPLVERSSLGVSVSSNVKPGGPPGPPWHP